MGNLAIPTIILFIMLFRLVWPRMINNYLSILFQIHDFNDFINSKLLKKFFFPIFVIFCTKSNSSKDEISDYLMKKID